MVNAGLLAREVIVCASGTLYWAGVVVQIARVRKRVGHSPNVRPKGLKERILWLCWLAIIVSWIGQPLVMNRFAGVWIFRLFEQPQGILRMALGLTFVIGGHAGTYWCYRALGDCWRLGIKKREKTNLVTAGPYAFVRHPIYAFQTLLLAGAALLLPTPLSLAVVLLQLICSFIKAADEETYLCSVHGQEYADYAGRAGRFLPRV